MSLLKKWTVVAAVLIGLMGVCGCSHDSETKPVNVTPSSTSSTSREGTPSPSVPNKEKPLTPADAKKLELTVVSPVKATRGLAWTPEMRGTLPAAPAGTVVKITSGTFQSSGVYGRVDAVVSGPIQAKVILHLELTDNQWLVFAMEEVK